MTNTELDAAGMTLLERRTLQEIALTGSWRKAAVNVGIDPRRVRNMFKNPAFKQQYDSFFDADDIRVTERELNLAADDVAWVFEEAKSAELEKKHKAECPSCHTKFDVVVKITDHNTRMRAAETLAKMRGLLRDSRSVEFSGKIEHVHWDYHETLILHKLDLGLPVPETVFRLVEAKAKLAGIELPAPVIEGEFSYVATNDTLPE